MTMEEILKYAKEHPVSPERLKAYKDKWLAWEEKHPISPDDPRYWDKFCYDVADAAGCELITPDFSPCKECVYTEGYRASGWECAIYSDKPIPIARRQEDCKYRRLSGDPTRVPSH